MAWDPRKTVRVVAAADADHQIEQVNILTTRAAALGSLLPEWIQDLRGVADVTLKTVTPTASLQKHLRTVVIVGYTTPH